MWKSSNKGSRHSAQNSNGGGKLGGIRFSLAAAESLTKGAGVKDDGYDLMYFTFWLILLVRFSENTKFNLTNILQVKICKIKCIFLVPTVRPAEPARVSGERLGQGWILGSRTWV